jgi:chromosomal replication initiator protein
MSLSPAEIWSRLLDRARLEIPEQTFRTWLEPTEPLEVEGSTLVVAAPDRFAAEWNESKHSQLLAGLAPIALGHPMKVTFTVAEERARRPQMDLFVAPPPPPPPIPAAGSGGGAATTAGAGATATASTATAFTAHPSYSQLSARYTFANFIIGKSNELAAAAAQAVAAAPGRIYNPLFIYGETGLGKTHLMQAVAHDIVERKPNTRVIFVGTEQFTNDLVGSIKGGTPTSAGATGRPTSSSWTTSTSSRGRRRRRRSSSTPSTRSTRPAARSSSRATAHRRRSPASRRAS